MALDGTKKAGPPRLALDTVAGARRSIGRLIRMRFRAELATDVFRDCVYGLSTLLGYEKHIAELRIEARLTELEARINEISERAAH